MTSVNGPRGRQPARVYWVRRVAVLVTVLALAFAVGRLLVGGGDDPADSAAITAAEPGKTPTAGAPTTTTPGTAAQVGPVPAATAPAKPSTAPPAVLAEPTGPCSVDEVTVAPSAVSTRTAGGRVPLVVELTGIRPACTFVVSSRSVAVRLNSGHDRIWSSQDCPASIRPQTVVVRSAVPAKVVVHWSGRRSDEDCSRSTDWALPGFYKVTSAAIGSEAADTRFQLVSPPRPVVIKTIHPKPRKQPTPSGSATQKVD